MEGEEFSILDRPIHIHETYLTWALREQRTATRAELGPCETRIRQPRQQTANHDRSRVGRMGKILRSYRHTATDRHSGQHVNSDGKASTGRHNRCDTVFVPVLHTRLANATDFFCKRDRNERAAEGTIRDDF